MRKGRWTMGADEQRRGPSCSTSFRKPRTRLEPNFDASSPPLWFSALVFRSVSDQPKSSPHGRFTRSIRTESLSKSDSPLLFCLPLVLRSLFPTSSPSTRGCSKCLAHSGLDDRVHPELEVPELEVDGVRSVNRTRQRRCFLLSSLGFPQVRGI